MPRRPLPDSRDVEEQRAQRWTQRVAIGFVLVIILLGLTLYLIG